MRIFASTSFSTSHSARSGWGNIAFHWTCFFARESEYCDSTAVVFHRGVIIFKFGRWAHELKCDSLKFIFQRSFTKRNVQFATKTTNMVYLGLIKTNVRLALHVWLASIGLTYVMLWQADLKVQNLSSIVTNHTGLLPTTCVPLQCDWVYPSVIVLILWIVVSFCYLNRSSCLLSSPLKFLLS